MNAPPDIEVILFETARGIDGKRNRDAFLSWAYRDSPENEAKMRRMLDAEEEAKGWFDRAGAGRARLAGEIASTGRLDLPASAFSDFVESPDMPAEMHGKFRVLKCLGKGSGGTVYLAEQTEPVARAVAIKILRAGLATPGFRAAFDREKQSLARLNHPNIAAIFDAGSTLSGRPFFVMEPVDGPPITRFCDQSRLTIRDRLALFLQVCAAIQHAHNRGLIHLDIKPSNVLVSRGDSTPIPKVIDFGIAAASAEDPGEQPARAHAGTPAYMSPEQGLGAAGDVDTRADVFSLGALLYELVAGSLPWEQSLPGVLPVKPSDYLGAAGSARLAAAAGARATRPARLHAQLKGDLDSIIQKAMAPDRGDRYTTVNAMVADIHRHLRGQPVAARPATRLYLFAKFLHRNRFACLAVGAVAMALVTGTGLALAGLIREKAARAEAEHSRALADSLLVKSEARKKIAEVAILLSQNKIAEADALFSSSPLANVEPSIEATNVFRFLGERYALLGRWDLASQCFVRLMEANRGQPAESTAEGMDILLAGPALLEAGNEKGYEMMRGEMLARLPSTRSAVAAEHMVKMCLLRPAPPEMMELLHPMAEEQRRQLPSLYNPAGNYHPHIGWFALAAAMDDYRRGQYAAALDMIRQCLAITPRVDSRIAAAKFIEAMALSGQGQQEAARLAHAEAADLTNAATPKVLVSQVESYDPSSGSWYAWAVARILMRESAATLGLP